MYIWTLLAIIVGATVGVFQIILLFSLFVKARKRKSNSRYSEQPAGLNVSPNKSMCVTDPFSGKLVNLERVSNASSLRSTRSVGFIAYDRPDSRERVTSLFENGTMNSERLNRSMASSAGSIGMEMKPINVNPIFKEESHPETEPGGMRATVPEKSYSNRF